MRVFIYAADQCYGGAQGMSDMGVFEVESIEAADRLGRDMSYDVIAEYDLVPLYDEDDDPDEYFSDEELYYEDQVEADLDWYVLEIKSDIKASLEELNELCHDLGEEAFKAMYCIEHFI